MDSLVQILLVAFSLLICCSLVCNVIQYPGEFEFISLVAPTNLPGIACIHFRLYLEANIPNKGPPAAGTLPSNCPSPITKSTS